MILAVVHQKGGVGKTTLALHLAAAFSLHGQRCLLIDADPQHSALDWSATRQTEPLFPVVGMPRAVLHRDVPGLSRGYDMVVIDGPPRVVDTLRSALAVSEVALIPVQPSPLDVWSCAPMVELVKEAQVYNPELRALLVINRRIPRTAIGRDVREALEAFELPVLTTTIGQRIAFAETLANGRTALEQNPTSAAAREIMQLVREMTEWTR